MMVEINLKKEHVNSLRNLRIIIDPFKSIHQNSNYDFDDDDIEPNYI
jgi:hypothetical protein